MKKILILTLVFALSVAAVNCLPVHGEEKIYNSVVRLHVIANSDSEEDQSLKLSVRDSVLAVIPEILQGCSDRETALNRISSNLDAIQSEAEKTVYEAGYAYPVTVSLGAEDYPRKSYEDICFPAGTYQSLQVKLGDSGGQNWWCVLFPELCLSGARRAEEAFVQVGLTPEQYRIITETEDTKYKIRFKILETFEGAFGG